MSVYNINFDEQFKTVSRIERSRRGIELRGGFTFANVKLCEKSVYLKNNIVLSKIDNSGLFYAKDSSR